MRGAWRGRPLGAPRHIPSSHAAPVRSRRPIHLTVLTFNIRYGSAPDGPQRWTLRKRLVIDRIRDANPDLIGLQECEDNHQARYLRRALGDYGFTGVRAEPSGPEMAPVLYRRSTFRKLGSGQFWLSESPGSPGSYGWGTAFPRTVTWVKLERRGTPTPLYFVNTHFDYAPGVASRSAALLRRWVDETVGGRPVVITGDFNVGKRSAAYRRLTSPRGDASGHDQAVRLVDAFRAAHPGGEGEGTYHAYGALRKPTPLDWILTSRHFAVVDADVDCTRPNGRFPSDHFPLVATIRFG